MIGALSNRHDFRVRRMRFKSVTSSSFDTVPAAVDFIGWPNKRWALNSRLAKRNRSSSSKPNVQMKVTLEQLKSIFRVYLVQMEAGAISWLFTDLSYERIILNKLFKIVSNGGHKAAILSRFTMGAPKTRWSMHCDQKRWFRIQTIIWRDFHLSGFQQEQPLQSTCLEISKMRPISSSRTMALSSWRE